MGEHAVNNSAIWVLLGEKITRDVGNQNAFDTVGMEATRE
jgi:hypothetical protein